MVNTSRRAMAPKRGDRREASKRECRWTFIVLAYCVMPSNSVYLFRIFQCDDGFGPDGDQYFLSLNISHLYLELDGNAGIIHIRVTEGSYVVDDQIQLYTVPRSNEETGGNEEGNSGTSTFVFAGIGALLLIAVLAVTMMFMRRGGGSDEQQDSVESFGGVEQMDPVQRHLLKLSD